MFKKIVSFTIAILFLWIGAACADSFWLRPLHKNESEPPAAYQQGVLLAIAQTQQDAEAIAEQYGITLVSWDEGLAQFSTERDVNEIIREGKENGWPELSRNDFADLN